VVIRNECQAKGTAKVGNKEDQDEDASAVLETVVQEHAGKDREGDEYAIWDLESHGLLSIL
jgi:hypothetical protein